MKPLDTVLKSLSDIVLKTPTDSHNLEQIQAHAYDRAKSYLELEGYEIVNAAILHDDLVLTIKPSLE